MVETVRSPGGGRVARLERVYYTADPAYKVLVQRGRFWRTLVLVPPLGDERPEELVETLRWSADSSRLYLEFNGRPVWMHQFAEP